MYLIATILVSRDNLKIQQNRLGTIMIKIGNNIIHLSWLPKGMKLK